MSRVEVAGVDVSTEHCIGGERVSSDLTFVDLSASSEICFYTSAGVDLVVDLFGVMAVPPGAAAEHLQFDAHTWPPYSPTGTDYAVECGDSTVELELDLLPGTTARVSLLTLHSTKGLEFSRVYVAGVEDSQLPGWRELQEQQEKEIQEARRLLYVGMTRAKDRLVLTRAERRDGRPTGGDLFLRDAGLAALSPRVPR